MKRTLLLAFAASAAPLASAAGLTVDVELPRIDTAEYHRPYVAVWIERPDHSVAANLSVWYDHDMRNNEGIKWLKDMRQWWRRGGRALDMPLDGVTMATRAPGRHSFAYTDGSAPLGTLAAGKYRLIVEASREHGGRELVEVPFVWPPAQAVRAESSGTHELGHVAVTLTP